MSKHITSEDFTLPLEFLTKSGDSEEIRIKVEVVAHLEDAKVFKQKFILEPSKFDTSQLAAHLSELDEIKDLVNAESASYNAEYLFGDSMVANQISEKLKEPLSQILKERGLGFVKIEHLNPVRIKPLSRSSTSTLSSAPTASGKKSKIWHTPFVITAVVLLIAVVGFIYYYSQTSGTISKNNNTISSLQSDNTSYKTQIASLQNQLSSANSQISSLQSQLSSGGSQVSNLQAQISSLQNQLTSANSKISSLQSQLSSGSSQVSNLQAQISSLQNQLDSATAQVTSLQNQNSSLQSIVSLSQSATKANAVTINQSAGASTSIVTFTASYAGYIVVSGTSTTSNGYITVTDSFSNYPNYPGYVFGTGATRTIPILPGTVTVSFANSNLLNGATATITVTYYY